MNLFKSKEEKQRIKEDKELEKAFEIPEEKAKKFKELNMPILQIIITIENNHDYEMTVLEVEKQGWDLYKTDYVFAPKSLDIKFNSDAKLAIGHGSHYNGSKGSGNGNLKGNIIAICMFKPNNQSV